MPSNIRTVGVIGTGVIGSSWTGLFLANGLQVLVSDPAPSAEEALATHLKQIWPTLEQLGLAKGASLDNYRFVGPTLDRYYGEVDFIQEVNRLNAMSRLLCSPKCRMRLNAWTSRRNSSERLTQALVQRLSLRHRHLAFLAPNLWPIAKKTQVRSSQSECCLIDLYDINYSENSGLEPPSNLTGIHLIRHLLISEPICLGRVLIGHPFNPPHLMPLVEVVPHPGTEESAVSVALDFYKAVGKRPILVKRETPGFAANRLQAALNYEAYSLVANGILSASDVGKWQLNGYEEVWVNKNCRRCGDHEYRATLGLLRSFHDERLGWWWRLGWLQAYF